MYTIFGEKYTILSEKYTIFESIRFLRRKVYDDKGAKYTISGHDSSLTLILNPTP